MRVFNIKKAIIRAVVLGAGVLSLVVGIVQGGYTDTLRRAVKICMECIGIG